MLNVAYTEQTEEYIRELRDLTKDTELYVSLSELVERFVDIDEYYNHEDWNLMQILANIKMLDFVELEKKEENNVKKNI